MTEEVGFKAHMSLVYPNDLELTPKISAVVRSANPNGILGVGYLGEEIQAVSQEPQEKFLHVSVQLETA